MPLHIEAAPCADLEEENLIFEMCDLGEIENINHFVFIVVCKGDFIICCLMIQRIWMRR